VPERGVTVSSLRHRGLAGVEPGYYRDSGSNGECLPDPNTVLVVAVAPPGQPIGVSVSNGIPATNQGWPAYPPPYLNDDQTMTST